MPTLKSYKSTTNNQLQTDAIHFYNERLQTNSHVPTKNNATDDAGSSKTSLKYPANLQTVDVLHTEKTGEHRGHASSRRKFIDTEKNEHR